MNSWIAALQKGGVIYVDPDQAKGMLSINFCFVFETKRIESKRNETKRNENMTTVQASVKNANKKKGVLNSNSESADFQSDNNQYIVLNKITENKMYFQNKDCEKLAKALCNKIEIRKTYLNHNTEAINKLVRNG